MNSAVKIDKSPLDWTKEQYKKYAACKNIQERTISMSRTNTASVRWEGDYDEGMQRTPCDQLAAYDT